MAQTEVLIIPAAQKLLLLFTASGSGEGHGQEQNCSVCCTSDLLTAKGPKYLIITREGSNTEHQERKWCSYSTKAHCFCLCLPEFSTVYQNGNRWHKANARTFSQFPTKRTDVFITCYMTAFNKMWQEAEVEKNGISLFLTWIASWHRFELCLSMGLNAQEGSQSDFHLSLLHHIHRAWEKEQGLWGGSIPGDTWQLSGPRRCFHHLSLGMFSGGDSAHLHEGSPSNRAHMNLEPICLCQKGLLSHSPVLLGPHTALVLPKLFHSLSKKT